MAAQSNAKSALEYVHEDMVTAEAELMAASLQLQKCPMPRFDDCPAGGKEYHEAMAANSRAGNIAMTAILQWNRIQLERTANREHNLDDQPLIKTKWFTARGKGAMLPIVLIVAFAVMGWLVYKATSASQSATRVEAALRQLEGHK